MEKPGRRWGWDDTALPKRHFLWGLAEIGSGYAVPQAPLMPGPCLPQTGELALGSVSIVAQSRFPNQVIAFKRHSGLMCFVGWDLL